MNTQWCAERPDGSLCKVLSWRDLQKKDAKEGTSTAGARPNIDAQEYRDMHEWWCAKPGKDRDGVCISLDIEHMHEWWCKSRPETDLCAVLEWRRKVKSGGNIDPATGKLSREPPPPMISRPESRQMMREWCEDENNLDSGPCRKGI